MEMDSSLSDLEFFYECAYAPGRHVEKAVE